MDFTDYNDKFKFLNEKVKEYSEELENLKDNIERESKKCFDESWKKIFPKLNCDFLSFVNYKQGNANISICSFKYYDPEQKMNREVRLLENNCWGEYDSLDDYGYGISTTGPISYKDLILGINKIKEMNPGLEINIERLKIREKVDSVTSFRCIEKLYPNSIVKLLDTGNIYYVGWDIPDRYIKVTIDNEEWVWWSDSAYGGSLDYCAQKNSPEYERFENLIKSIS